MLFELINPSDPYVLEANDFEVAVYASLLLGQGGYGLSEIGGDHEMPIFLFGGADDWFKAQFGRTPQEFVDHVLAHKLPEVIACLESMTIGGAKEHQALNELLTAIPDPEARAQAKAKWLDAHRSSLNDIGRRAVRLVAKLKEKATADKPERGGD